MAHVVGFGEAVAEDCVEAPELLAPFEVGFGLLDADLDAGEGLAFAVHEPKGRVAFAEGGDAGAGGLQVAGKGLGIPVPGGTFHLFPFFAVGSCHVEEGVRCFWGSSWAG